MTLNLKLKFSVEETNLLVLEKHVLNDIETIPIEHYKDLFQLFVERIKRILIIGDPGAGKTILLLNFADFLIDLAQKNDNFPIPLILDLATWNK